jgi:hypothetical protein
VPPFQVLVPFSAERPTIYANGFTMWHYKSADQVSDVLSDGYFDLASDMLRAGDFIFCNLKIGGAGQHDLLVVAANAAGAVRVAAPGFMRDPCAVAAKTSAQTGT